MITVYKDVAAIIDNAILHLYHGLLNNNRTVDSVQRPVFVLLIPFVVFIVPWTEPQNYEVHFNF